MRRYLFSPLARRLLRLELVAVALLFVPAVALAVGFPLLHIGGDSGGAIGGFLGAFLGNVFRDAYWLRKHRKECPAFRAHEDGHSPVGKVAPP